MTTRYPKAMNNRDSQENLVNKHSRKEYKYLLKSKHIFQKDLFYFRRITYMFMAKHHQEPGVFPISLSLKELVLLLTSKKFFWWAIFPT